MTDSSTLVNIELFVFDEMNVRMSWPRATTDCRFAQVPISYSFGICRKWQIEMYRHEVKRYLWQYNLHYIKQLKQHQYHTIHKKWKKQELNTYSFCTSSFKSHLVQSSFMTSNMTLRICLI
jgi:hypothetical protein